MADTKSITRLLGRIRKGDEEAVGRLMDLVYPELRRIARLHVRKEPAGATLQPTALVHEAYLNLFGSEPVQWQDRAHFFAVAARQMRRILVDHARMRHAAKRGGGRFHLSLECAANVGVDSNEQVILIDQGLRRLEELDPRAGRMVELRFFAGLTEKEAAGVLGVSASTLRADWEFARAWLYDQLKPGSV